MKSPLKQGLKLVRRKELWLVNKIFSEGIISDAVIDRALDNIRMDNALSEIADEAEKCLTLNEFGKALIEIIPEIYNTKRTVRIIP